jgi:hypothetical protein
LLARECPVADQHADVIDAERAKRACFLGTRNFVDLHKHGRRASLVNVWLTTSPKKLSRESRMMILA